MKKNTTQDMPDMQENLAEKDLFEQVMGGTPEQLKSRLEKEQSTKQESKPSKKKPKQKPTENTSITENTETQSTSPTLRTRIPQKNNEITARVSRALDILEEISEKIIDIRLQGNTEQKLQQCQEAIKEVQNIIDNSRYNIYERLTYIQRQITILDSIHQVLQETWEREAGMMSDMGSMIKQRLNEE